MAVTELVLIATFLVVIGALAIVHRQLRRDDQIFVLRSITAYDALRQQVGMAVESGRRPLLTLGRGSLHTPAGPTSMAALQVLQDLGQAAGNGSLTPYVTVGAATLLPIAQDRLRTAADRSAQPDDFHATDVQFIADESFPFAYAAGTAEIIGRNETGDSIAIGRFGTELAIIGEAAARSENQQIMGSDDTSAIAIATAFTQNSLWGEEIFAAGAYLRRTALQMASVRVQDLMRWAVAIAMILAAILQLL